MPPLPRATCPTCDRGVALRSGGELREHRDDSGDMCPASGMTPAQVERAIEREVNALRRASR